MATEELEYNAAAERLFNGDNSPMENPLFNLGTDLLGEFEIAKQHRLTAEQKWLKDLRQYKGIYEPDVEAKMRGSKSFLRKTRVKVESVDARLMDLLFPANKERNYSIEATPEPSVPEAVEKQIYLKLQQAFGAEPSKNDMRLAIRKFVDDAAKKMANRIDDQLAEAKYRDVARNVIHSGNLYGTGILKGPLVERRTRLSYIYDHEKRKYVQKTQSYAAPFLTHVPIWRFYPDMTVTQLKDARYTWEHHRLTRADLVELSKRKSFNEQAIKSHIDTNPDGSIVMMNYEQHIRIMGNQMRINSSHKTGQYDVYERWGWLTGEILSSAGVNVPQDRLHESFFSNAWMFPDGTVIKAVLAPIDGVQWPYHMYYFDKDETSVFGEGIASIMRDDQDMINAAARMILDNAAVTAGPQFEVFVPAFPPQANLTDIYPGKVWPRTGGDFQYPAIRELQFNSHMGELEAILRLFDNNADETLALPKYSYGENVVKGAAGTASGMSMLMAQANIAIRELVGNFDEVTRSFLTALYHWNMTFGGRDMDDHRGDFNVVARGASSLMAKEVRAQNLSMFVSTLQPEQRGRINWDVLTEQQAEALELKDVVMNEEEYQAFQESPMAKMQAQMAQMQQQLQIALMQSQLAESQAKAAKAEAEAMQKRIESGYTAMQTAGIAATNPTIAPAGDAILRSAGWKDMDRQPGSGAELAQGQPVDMPQGDMQPQSPNIGQQQGIETPELGD